MPENVVVATASVGISADVTALEKALAGVPDMVSGVQSKVAEAASGMSATVASAFESWGPKLVQAGALMTAGITVPIIAATTALTNMGMGFEAEMTRVQVLSEASAEQLKAMTDQAIELGIKTPFSVEQAAQAMSKFSEQGFKANETMAAMPGVLALASAAQVDTGKAAQATADILHGFKLAAEDAAHVADVLAKASADSGTGVAEMANSFRYVGPLAAQLGVSIEEVAAMFEVLGDAGVRNAKAGTAIREMMMDLLNPSKEAAAAMEAYGISVKDSAGNMLPLTAILEQFKTIQDNATNSTELANLAYDIWKTRSTDILPLIWAGKEALDKKVISLKDATGAAEAMATAMQQNVKGSLEQFTSSVDSAGKILFLAFSPYIKEAIDWARKLADEMVLLAKAFLDAPTWFKDTTVAIIALAAAIGPVTALVGGLMTAWGTITTLSSAVTTAFAAIATGIGVTVPVLGLIVAAIAAVGAAGYALYENWGSIGPLLSALWADLVKIGKDLFGGIGEFFAGLWKTISDTAISVWQSISGTLGGIWTAIADFFGAIWTKAADFFVDIWNGLKSKVAAAWEAIGGVIESALAKIGTLFPETAKAIAGFGQQIESTSPQVAGLSAKTNEGSTAADEYRKKIEAASEQLRLKTASAAGAAEGIHKHRQSVEAASEQVKVFNVDLDEMSAYLERAKMRAEDAKIDVAFAKLNAELAKVPPNLGNVPPLLDEIAAHADAMMSTTDEGFEALNEEIAKLPPNLGGVPPLLVEIQRQSEDSMRRAGDHLRAYSQIWDDFKKGLDAVWKNIKQGLGDIIGDLAVGKGSWSDFGDLALHALQSIVSLGIKTLIDAFWEMIKEGGVITAVKGAFTALANGISSVFKNLFDGIGDGINAVTSSISGGASGAGVAASGAGGGAASAAGGGLSGAISMISGAVTAVASVIQAFQLHGIGTDTGRIEEQTRKTANELANLRADEWIREEHWYLRTGEMWQATKDVRDAIGVLNTTAAEGLGNIFNRLGEMWNAVLAMVPGGAAAGGDGLITPTEGEAPSGSAQAVLERLTSISETLQFAREFQLSHLESIAQALGGKNVDIPAGEVPLDADGNPIIPTIGIDPGSMESLLNMIQASNEHLSAISMSTLRAADALSTGTPGAGGSGATQIGDVLVGGGGIGTLNVTVNAETTSSADEIAGMVLEQILVYVPTGGA